MASSRASPDSPEVAVDPVGARRRLGNPWKSKNKLDFMGFNGDLLWFNGTSTCDLMDYEWDIPSGKHTKSY